MADKRDYYEILGVDKNADEAAIKKAYRALAKKYHPDMNPDDPSAEAKFKEASEAYAVLSDPDKRRQYDQFGHAALTAQPAAEQADLTLTALISAIYSVIFLASEISSEAEEEHQETAPDEARILFTEYVSLLKKLYSDAKKKLKLTLRKNVRAVREAEQNPEHHPRLVMYVTEKARLLLLPIHYSDRYRRFRHVGNAAVKEKSLRKNVPTVAEQVIRPLRRNMRLNSLQV